VTHFNTSLLKIYSDQLVTRTSEEMIKINPISNTKDKIVQVCEIKQQVSGEQRIMKKII
jgi:hypothetical protein